MEPSGGEGNKLVFDMLNGNALWSCYRYELFLVSSLPEGEKETRTGINPVPTFYILPANVGTAFMAVRSETWQRVIKLLLACVRLTWKSSQMTLFMA